MRTKPHCGNHAFTRIEFLALAVVIFLLMSVALPSAANGQARTKSTVCLSNLRHLVFAWQLYTLDNADILPGNHTGGEASGGGGGSASKNPWASGWLDWTSNNRDNTNISLIRDIRYARMADYILTERNVHKCPADTFQSALQRMRGIGRLRSVAMNGTLGDGNATSGPWDQLYRQARTMAEIYRPSPAATTVIFDEHPDSINDPLFYPPRTQWIDLPANHHNGAGSFSFADGHVELHPWRNSTLRNHRVRLNFSFPTVRPGDPDLTWMSYTSQRSRDQTY